MFCRDHHDALVGQINTLQVQATLGGAFMRCQATIIKGIRNKLTEK